MTTVNTLCLKLGRQEVLRRARQRIKTFAFNFFCLSLFFLPFKCQKHEIIKDWCPNGISFNLINQIRFVLDRNKDRIRIGPKLKLSSSSCGFDRPGSGGIAINIDIAINLVRKLLLLFRNKGTMLLEDKLCDYWRNYKVLKWYYH